MKRRSYIQAFMGGSLAIALPFRGVSAPDAGSDEWTRMISDLLKEWCEGMLRLQINDPENPAAHGALSCPSCAHIHGRCMDAVYPFFFMADATGDPKYITAGLGVLEWAEKNVSQPDGSWTVISNPKSWRGITVFGAIALAEALHHHGHILEDDVRTRLTARLRKAADFIHTNFTMTYSNTNYGYTAVYALLLLGKIFDEPKYTQRSHELAAEVKKFLTEPNKLVFGEGKVKDGKNGSLSGLKPVDLGYNVEESLNNVVLYAILEQDKEMLDLLTQSLNGHLEFMLPDGAWDNSWGTRQAKWSYWGSRTTDGCQQAYGLMADRNPTFGTAAFMSTDLMRRCTKNGLLYGGPHYASRGVSPCVHHTFSHAKSLAAMLDFGNKAPQISCTAPLPRKTADGVKYFPEVNVWTAARGPWRATVSAYDWVYRPYVQQATGGSLALLWNEQLQETLFAASMAEYILVEKNNQQQNPDPIDYALTPRLETRKDGTWYTNLYDLKAAVTAEDQNSDIRIDADVHLVDRERTGPLPSGLNCRIGYRMDANAVTINASRKTQGAKGLVVSLVLPLISEHNEPVRQISEQCIEINKGKGTVRVEANRSVRIKKTERGRVFNLVPGFEALPIEVDVPEQGCTVKITVLPKV